MSNIVVLVTPGLEPETARLQAATGGNSRAIIAGPVSLVALGADDSAAIEYARQTAGSDGTVTALTVGDSRADVSLRYALAQGADKAVRVDSEDASNISTERVARIVAAALETMEPVDALVLGQRGSAYTTGLLPGYLAAISGRNVIANITEGEQPEYMNSEKASVVAVSHDRSRARRIVSLKSINEAYARGIQVVTLDQIEEAGTPLMKVQKKSSGARSAIVHANEDLQTLARETAKIILSVRSDA